jgi:preprotein translocase subunit SecD
MDRSTASLMAVAAAGLLVVAGAVPAAGATAAAGPGAAPGVDRPAQVGPPSGAVVELSVLGTTAEGVDVASTDRERVRSVVAAELGVRNRSVAVVGDAVEVRRPTVSVATFRDALAAAGLDARNVTVRAGVTERTRELVADVLRRRFREAGLTGVEVSHRRVDGGPRVVVRAPDATAEEVRRVATRRGRVALVARAPGQGDENRTAVLATNDDFASVGPAQQGGGGRSPYVPVTLTDEGAERFTSRLVDLGFTGEGVGACGYRESPDRPGYCIYTRLNGETVFAAGMSPSLAEQIRSGEFGARPAFTLQTQNVSRAQDLTVALESGALPAPVRVESAGSAALLTDTPPGTTGGASPGFTAWLALVALLAVAVLAGRR